MRKAKKTKKAEIATFLTLGLVLVGAVLSLLSGVMVNRQKNIASNPRAQSTQTTCTIDQKCGSGNHWLCKPNYTTVTFNGINFDGNGCDPNRCPTKELPFACYVVDDRCDKGKIRYRWYGCKGQPCENTVINQGTHGPGKLVGKPIGGNTSNLVEQCFDIGLIQATNTPFPTKTPSPTSPTPGAGASSNKLCSSDNDCQSGYKCIPIPSGYGYNKYCASPTPTPPTPGAGTGAPAEGGAEATSQNFCYVNPITIKINNNFSYSEPSPMITKPCGRIEVYRDNNHLIYRECPTAIGTDVCSYTCMYRELNSDYFYQVNCKGVTESIIGVKGGKFIGIENRLNRNIVVTISYFDHDCDGCTSNLIMNDTKIDSNKFNVSSFSCFGNNKTAIGVFKYEDESDSDYLNIPNFPSYIDCNKSYLITIQ